MTERWADLVGQARRIFAQARDAVLPRVLELADGFPRRLQRENAAVIASVAALHVVFLWLIVLSLRVPHVHVDNRELQVTLSPAKERVETPLAVTQALPVMSIPSVVIEDDHPTDTINAASAALVLAPRPDPEHLNTPPNLAAVSAKSGALMLVLRILVLADGTIAEAQVVTSSGQAGADAAAIGYVKTNWRFIPAKLNGTAVQYWTTVSVPFKSEE